MEVLRPRLYPPPPPVSHGQILPDVTSLRLLRGPGGAQHRLGHAYQLAPELVRGDLVTHVVISPLGVQPEVMLALKLIGFPEKIPRLLQMFMLDVSFVSPPEL